MITADASFTSANAQLHKGRILLALEIDGYDRVFTNFASAVDGHVPWIKDVGNLTWEVSALEGTSSLNDLEVTVRDAGRLLTADMPGFTFEGKTCRLKTGFAGMSYGKFVTLFTGEVNSVPISNDGMCYTFVCNDARLQLKQVIYTIADDGLPTDSDHTKTVNGHPLDILTRILVDYIGMDFSGFDSTKLNKYRDETFGGAQMEFHIDSPPEAKEFIETQLFKPLGGYLRVTNLGVLTPQFFTPLAGTIAAVTTLTRSNMVGIPDLEQADLINTISYRFDKVGDDFIAESVLLNDVSITKYGRQGQHVIEADGVRSGFQGFFTASQTADAIFGRMGNKNPRLQVPLFWNPGCLLELGDFVALTHDLLPNRYEGTMGLVNWLFEVEGLVLDPMRGTVEVTLVDASYLEGFGAYRIAPDAVPDWTLASEYEKNRYMFITDLDGEYSDNVPGNPLG